jgi:hypothetical protein
MCGEREIEICGKEKKIHAKEDFREKKENKQ